MRALIDLDVPVFTECASAQDRGCMFGGAELYEPDITGIADGVCRVVEEWVAAAQCDSLIVCYSHPSRRNYRKHLLPSQYKVARTGPKPGGYVEVMQAVVSRYDNMTIDGVEGDDVIGILHTSDRFGETVSVSIDKDMRTLPGWYYNPNKMARPEFITENQATRFWMWQTLTGDAVDGYKGLRGVGPKKADAVLEGLPEDASPHLYLKTAWERVFHKYVEVTKASSAIAHTLAVEQARMARILHRTDYCRETNEIKLWHPDSPDFLRLDTF